MVFQNSDEDFIGEIDSLSSLDLRTDYELVTVQKWKTLSNRM